MNQNIVGLHLLCSKCYLQCYMFECLSFFIEINVERIVYFNIYIPEQYLQ